MPRLTKEERAELEAKLAADDDDDDDEVELGFADGSHFRGKMSRARQVAKARGYKLEADPPDDSQDDAKDTSKAKDTGTRFAGRRVS